MFTYFMRKLFFFLGFITLSANKGANQRSKDVTQTRQIVAYTGKLSPGMRVNTRYINSARGTPCSLHSVLSSSFFFFFFFFFVFFFLSFFHFFREGSIGFCFSVALHPQKPSGLLGTGSPGLPPRLSHSS